MSDKFVYQNARVKSMESSLFTLQSVARLLDCTSVQAAFKTLLDMGFGSGASVSDGDFDALFALEEERAAQFLREFNVDGTLDAFLAQYDFLNLKSIFKSNITGKPIQYAPNGMYATDDIKRWLTDEGASDAPAALAPAISDLKSLSQNGGASPHAIDCAVDRAMYEFIFSGKKRFGKETVAYFTRKADGINLGAFVRCRRLRLPKRYFEEGFIKGGELDFLPEIYDAPMDALKEKCRRTAYDEAAKRLVDEGDMVAFETAEDNTLLRMWKENKDDMFGISPIVAFYLTKVTQIRVAKLAVAGIKNGVEKEKIKKRMRELYA